MVNQQRTLLTEIGVVVVLVLFIIMMAKNYFSNSDKLDISFSAPANRMTVVENVKHPEIHGSTIILKDSKTLCEYLIYHGSTDKMVLLTNTCGRK